MSSSTTLRWETDEVDIVTDGGTTPDEAYDDRRPMTDGGRNLRRRGPRGRLHLPTWTKDCWRGRPSGMCWLCQLRLFVRLLPLGQSDTVDAGTDQCPSCGEPIDKETIPDGYDDVHCSRCATEIEQRQDWLSTTATLLGGSN
jgi:hypothetical protein